MTDFEKLSFFQQRKPFTKPQIQETQIKILGSKLMNQVIKFCFDEAASGTKHNPHCNKECIVYQTNVLFILVEDDCRELYKYRTDNQLKK